MSKQPELNLKKLQPHPLGAMFPPMGDEAYAQLKSSLKTRGFDADEAIVLFEGGILDGNHRYTACKATRVEPQFTKFKGDYGDAVEYVIGKNLGRRHLTLSQSAALGAELIEKMEAAEAAEKAAAKEAAKAAKAAGKKPEAPKRKPAKGTKAARAAKAVGASTRNVAKARALKKSDPEKFEAVKAGKEKLGPAAKEDQKKQSAADKAGDAFAAAKQRIREVDEKLALDAENKLTAKEVISLSLLTAAEMNRIKPLIEAGWKLKAALGYQSTNLGLAHPLRAYIDRCMAQNGTFGPYTIEAYGKSYVVNIDEQK